MNKTFKIIAAAVAVMMIAVFSGCAPKKTAPTSTPAPTPSPKAEATLSPELMADAVNITIEIQDGGKIKAELYPNVAPITVANFVKLANEHFYDGLIFHRVIEGFMIQG